MNIHFLSCVILEIGQRQGFRMNGDFLELDSHALIGRQTATQLRNLAVEQESS